MTLFQKFTRSIPLSTQLYALIVPAFLAAIIVMSAILSSSLREVRPFADLRLITHYEAFHVIAHLVIFSSVVVMLGLWKNDSTPGRNKLIWVYVIAGGLLIEFAQAIAGHASISLETITAISFDLTVDFFGALAGLGLLATLNHQK